MGRPKKQIEGNVISIDDTPTEIPVKKKKELSEKQKDNLRKGMEALKERRRKLMEDEDIIKPVEAPKVEETKAIEPPKPIESKPRISKPKPNYLTADDFNNFKNDLLSQLRPIEKIVEKEKIVDKIIEKPVEKVVVEKLTGSALLNEIFFKRI